MNRIERARFAAFFEELAATLKAYPGAEIVADEDGNHSVWIGANNVAIFARTNWRDCEKLADKLLDEGWEIDGQRPS